MVVVEDFAIVAVLRLMDEAFGIDARFRAHFAVDDCAAAVFVIGAKACVLAFEERSFSRFGEN